MYTGKISVFINYIQRRKGESTNKLEFEFEYETQTQNNEPSFIPYTTKITCSTFQRRHEVKIHRSSEKCSISIYTGCHRRNGPNFLMLNYTDITQNTYVPS